MQEWVPHVFTALYVLEYYEEARIDLRHFNPVK